MRDEKSATQITNIITPSNDISEQLFIIGYASNTACWQTAVLTLIRWLAFMLSMPWKDFTT